MTNKLLSKIKGINTLGRVIYIAIALGIILTCTITAFTKNYSDVTSRSLATNFIRFHVIANSDSQEDQELKLKVRDAVLEEMAPLLKESTSIEESRNILTEQMTTMTQIATQVMAEAENNYAINVSLEMTDFPTKKYGDVVLPAGQYEALCIRIGEAKGRNWWCVMFPPLCFVDVTYGVVPEDGKDELKGILTDEEYDMILVAKNHEDLDVKVKFKIVEWWQQHKQKSEQSKK